MRNWAVGVRRSFLGKQKKLFKLMGVQDLFVTPIYLILFTLLAYLIRQKLTVSSNRKYFMPALLLRFVAAILLGCMYQFYYDGGDTFNYYNQAGIVYEAFLDRPSLGLKLIFSNGEYDPETYQYASRILWYKSAPEFLVIRMISCFSIVTGHTYSAISLFFAFFSFIGIWSLFSVINRLSTGKTTQLAFAILFLPTVVFWSSGIMKDSITLACFCISIWLLFRIIEKQRTSLTEIIVLAVMAWVLLIIKIYVLLCLVPFVIAWLYYRFSSSIRNSALKILLVPVIFVCLLGSGYLITRTVSDTSEKYQFNSLAQRVYITSYDIRYFSGKDAGSGYSIGKQDGTWETLFTLVPAAINVALFRPYLWEVKNPLMLLSAFEALLILLISLSNLPKVFSCWKTLHPMLKASMIFSLIFAFAVGVSSYNFGTLSRYKIPLMPLYLSVLLLAQNKKIVDK